MPIMGSTIAETVSITENGIHDVARYTSANVEVEPVTASLNVTPTTLVQQITPDTGVDGFDEVNISAVTSDIDNNIVPENIKKDVTILGVTGTHEGGGSLVNGIALTIADSDNLDLVCGFIERDEDWETKSNIEIPLKSEYEGAIWKTSSPVGWLYSPFTLINGSKDSNGVCTLNIKDSKNVNFSVKYLKRNIALAAYTSINGASPTVFAPVYPKVGDEVFHLTSVVGRKALLGGTGKLVHFSTSIELSYYDMNVKRAKGPITIKEIEWLNDGTPVLILQDKDGNQVTGNAFITNYADTYISQNGAYTKHGYRNINVNITPILGRKTITRNGTYNAIDDGIEGYEQVTVSVGGGNDGQVCQLEIDWAPGFPQSTSFYRDFNAFDEHYVWVNYYGDQLYTLAENPTIGDLIYSDSMCEFDSTTISQVYYGGVVINGELYYKHENCSWAPGWGYYVNERVGECYIPTTSDPEIGDTAYTEPDTSSPQVGIVEQVYPQGSGGGSSGKYELDQEILDDFGNTVGTVQGFHTDENGNEYALVLLEIPAGTYKSLSEKVSIPDLAEHSSPAIWCDKETATSKCDKILNSGYVSEAVNACRDYQYTIEGITYYGQLPTLSELVKISMNIQLSVPGTSITTSSQVSSTNMKSMSMTLGNISNINKTTAASVTPILELPNN